MSTSTLEPLKPRSRLERLATVVTWVFWLATVVAVLQVILALTRSGTLLAGGSSQPGPAPLFCLDTPQALLPHAATGVSHAGLAAGVRATWTNASLCTAHPTFGQALAYAVTLLPPDLLRLGALYLALRLARTAARDGVYTAQAARLVLILGWWLLAGEVVAALAEGLARINLLSHLVTWPVDWLHWPAPWSAWWPVAAIGLGMITFARVMRISAGMRADLEGTV